MKVLKEGWSTNRKPDKNWTGTVQCTNKVNDGKSICGAVFSVVEDDLMKVPREHSMYGQSDYLATCPFCKATHIFR